MENRYLDFLDPVGLAVLWARIKRLVTSTANSTVQNYISKTDFNTEKTTINNSITSVRTELGNYLPLTGGTLTGSVNFITASNTISGDERSLKLDGSEEIRLLNDTVLESTLQFGYNVVYARLSANSSGLNCSSPIFITSDERAKENIKTISDEELNKLENLEYKQFNYKDSNYINYGVIAQDVLNLNIQNVVSEEDSTYSVNYTSLHSLEIAKLKKEIKDLKSQISELTEFIKTKL